MSEQAEYRVALDVYNGPLDLLLFLIQRDEVDIYDIPIARITGQYIAYVELLEQLDPEAAGQFLVLAATLMEMKSRTLLPKPPPEEVDEEIIDPRLELVHQLLEYKRFKDAARSLEDAASEQALKHARKPVLPEAPADEHELDNLDIWDLFEAFNKLLQQIGKAGATYRIDVDDTPISLHADDILDSIDREGGSQKFEDIFVGRTKAEMIGLFLALLELIRQHRIRATQDRPFATIFIELLDSSPITVGEETIESHDLSPGDSVESREAEGAVSHGDPNAEERLSHQDQDSVRANDYGERRQSMDTAPTPVAEPTPEPSETNDETE